MEFTKADIDRFMKKVWKDPVTKCWVWMGTGKYGVFTLHGQMVPASHFAYEAFVGPITGGDEIDHKCWFTKCVNPAHIRTLGITLNRMRKRPKYGTLIEEM